MSIARAWDHFWLDRDIEPGRLAALRAVLFGLLGADLTHLMIRHAWRYGAGDFNLSHFGPLDALLPLPRADWQVAIYLIAAFFAWRVAAGIAVRGSLFALTVLYAGGYFWSRLDGYQHHYLIAWLLLLSWAVPFHEAPGVDRPRPGPGRIRGLGLSLLYAQIAIVYLFTAITKLAPSWLDGWALERQITTPWLRDLLRSVELSFGMDRGAIYALIALVICAWQFLASASFVFPRLRVFACLTGPIFHIMVEVIGLKVEWFSYYMIALYYLLLFPDTWFAATSRALRRLLAGLAAPWAALTARWEPPAALGLAATVLAAAAAGGLAASGDLPSGGLVGAAVGLAVLSSWRPAIARVRLPAQLLFAAGLALLPRLGGSAYDFYRFQGGDALGRGELELAERAYRRAVELGPDVGSRRGKLGEVLLRLGREDEARAVWEEALRLDPGDRRAARGLERLGR